MDASHGLFQLVEGGAKYGGLFDNDGCRRLCDKILNYYDGNSDGIVDNLEVRNMMTDCYRAVNKEMRPTASDLVNYVRVISKRTDRSNITKDDIQKLVHKLFGATQETLSHIKQPDTKQNAQGSYQSPNSNNLLNSQQQYQQSQYQGGLPQSQSQYQGQQFNSQKIETPNGYTQSNQTKTSYTTNQPYNQQTMERLTKALKLFYKIDTNRSGYIERYELRQLLKNTYYEVGISHEPTQAEIDDNFRAFDANSDGRVSLKEWEQFFVKSLERLGYQIY